METITTATPKQAPPANSLLIPASAWFGVQRGVAQPVPLTQYDDTLPVLAVALYLNGQPYTVPEGAAVNVRMDKRDGHYVYNPALGVSEDRQTAYIGVTLQMTTVSGDFWPTLEIVVDGQVAGTSYVPLRIAQNPVPEDAVSSTDEFKTVQELARQAQAAAEAAAASEKNAASSATQAADSATQAEEYAQQAQQVAQGAMGWYADPQALQSAHPTGHNGQWAIVGTTDTIWIWDSDTSAWVDSGSNMDLSQYYTKTEADARFLGAGDETVVRFVEISIDEETGAVTFTDPQFDFAFLAGCIRYNGKTCVVRVKGIAATYSPNKWSEAEDGAVTLSFREHGYIGDSSGQRMYYAPTLEITQRGGAVTGRRVNYIYNTLPNVDESDAGKALVVRADGSGYELRSMLEKNISDYYAMRRTGKVYQTRLWKFASNPTSVGEKLLDNAGLVFEPSTDTEEGQDDYLNGQNPMFEWVNVNYIRDDDGAPRPTAIEGQTGFKTSGAVDVGAMQMSFWYKIDASGEDYIDYYVSDTPHPELGLVPWPECVRADGTVLPWCIGSKYISGEASDGMPRSQPGLKPIRNVSHNSMITSYQQKGPGYWGAGAAHNTFQILFNAIKGATKSSQALYAGTTSYDFQYEASVQRAEAETWFPVTNSQAANIVVGGYVSVGYGSDNNGTVNIDRGQSTVHACADDVKVLRIEDLDESNKAVYLDVEKGFDTRPVALTDSLSAPIIMSSMHWWSGATDSVRGRHDGSPGSNTDSKHPYRVQGREYAVGGYLVASDTVARLNEDGTRTVYAAPRGTAHSKDTAAIQSAYKQIGTIPLNSSGSVADYWVGDAGIDEDTGAWYPATQGSGSTQGCGDQYFAGGTGANAFREYLQCGNLGVGSGAGSCCLYIWYWLGGGGWHCLAGD